MAQRLLALIPHPDDESYAMADLLARSAERGVEVHVVTATRGEGGRDYTHPDEVSGKSAVAAIRSAELDASCALLGLPPAAHFDWPDGGLREMPSALAIADLVDLFRDIDPDLIVSLDQDGVYGHADHVALWEYTRLALASILTNAPDRDRRWLAAVFPRGLFLPQWRLMTAGPDAASVGDDAPDLGAEAAAVDLRRDVADPRRKRESIGAHRSQLADGTPQSLFPPGVVDTVLREECYRLVFGPALVDADPFAGLV